MDTTTQVWLWMAFAGMVIGAVIFGGKAIVNSLFDPLRNILIGLWICSLIVELKEFRLIAAGVETAIYPILDLSAKVGLITSEDICAT
ncbi:MAG TPA: hypothetical protein VL134_14140 [Leptolyngbya sp.]|jgi:bacteriorhodopsin|nr:hypothetical protein [Leptolyngbya sp.]